MNISYVSGYHVIIASVVLSIGLLLLGCDSKVESGAVINSVTENKVAEKNENSVTKIGAFILSSENDQPQVKSFQQGADLASSNTSSKPFQLEFLDVTQGNSAETASLKSLIENDKSPALLYWTADDIYQVAPYLNQSDAVGLVAWEVTEKVIPLGANIYGFGFSTELTFTKMAKFAGNVLRSNRIGVIAASETRFDIQSEVFVEESKSLANTIVFNERVAADSADISPLIERAVKENCDTLFVVLPSPALVRFIKAVRASRFKGKLLVGDTLFAPELLDLGADAEGIYMAQPWSDDSALKTLYSNKYGASPDGVALGIVALGYDTIKCLQGIGKPFDAYSIKQSLLSQPCQGLTGNTQFTGERIAQRRKRILTVKNGQFVLAE